WAHASGSPGAAFVVVVGVCGDRSRRYVLTEMRLCEAADELVLDDDLLVATDNDAALARLPDGAFDLIYVDPPFNTGRVQSRRTLSVTADGNGDRTGFGGRRYASRLLATLSYDD